MYKRQGLYTALAVTLMHKDFLDKLVEHGNGQLVEVLIFVNQSEDVYKRQAWDGRRMSEQITPPLRV